MITNRHNVELKVNGNALEIYSQSQLNIRINNTVFDPEKITDTQTEYSFSFNLPVTPKNIEILGYTNVLSKNNKFNTLYDTEVYADGHLIFTGKLKTKTVTQTEYQCNLVGVKARNISEAFGEMKMNDLKWYVPFAGPSTMNSVNADNNSKYFFPLVCYGTFQKKPQTVFGNEINSYTSKYDIDKYVMWYQESLPPSLNINEVVRRLCEQKGYKASGDIFNDPTANSIYLSEHLKDKQDPLYNYGGPMGKAKTSVTFTNYYEKRYASSIQWDSAKYLDNTLKFPTDKTNGENYQYESAAVYDVWSESDERFRTRLTTEGSKTLWRKNCFVAPANGVYFIKMSGWFSLEKSPGTFKVTRYKYGYDDDTEDITLKKSFDNFPMEVQLVKNNNDIELIRPINRNSVYPHEAPPTPTTGDRTAPKLARGNGGFTGGGHNGNNNGNSGQTTTSNLSSDYNGGFIPTNTLVYDQYASSDFILGAATFENTPSVRKRGYSWKQTESEYINSRYDCEGYRSRKVDGNTTEEHDTTYNYCRLSVEPYETFRNYVANTSSPYLKRFNVCALVELKKNDLLMLKAVMRGYRTPENANRAKVFPFEIQCDTEITAMYPDVSRIAEPLKSAILTSEFDTELNLGGFLSADMKASDFIEDYIKTFNLQYIIDGNEISFNKKKHTDRNQVPVDIDDRTNSNQAQITQIEYPSTMSVQYSIDEEEAGFYDSVPQEHINGNDWKDYADRGYTVIKYGGDNGEATQTLNMSYTWYKSFNFYQTSPDKTTQQQPITIQLPIISKDEWMIDNYKYEESMQNDGKGLKQRLWYRTTEKKGTVYTENGEPIDVYIPVNRKDSYPELDYKTEHKSLLTEYYNIRQSTDSNYIEVEAYLTPDEYMRLKKGAPIHFDSDIYDICTITGYDPTGGNRTRLKAMKRT